MPQPPPQKKSWWDQGRSDPVSGHPTAPDDRIPACPGCGRNDVRKASVIWEGGTTLTTTRGTGIGVIGGELAIGGTTSQSVNQTKLAERAAPPRKPSMEKAIGIPIVGLVLIALSAAAQFLMVIPVLFLAFIAFTVWAVRDYQRELVTWTGAIGVWERRCWVCRVCGNIFLAT